MKLDLACGQRCKDGFDGVDIHPGPGIVYQVDLFRFPWRHFPPTHAKLGKVFEDNSVDEIHCSHFIEHTPDLIAFMDECYRIMKVGAEIRIVAPYYTSMRAWQDPTHTRAISDATFAYFDKNWREREKLDHYDIKCDFERVHCEHAILPQFAGLPIDRLQAAMAHQWNVVEDITVILRKR